MAKVTKSNSEKVSFWY